MPRKQQGWITFQSSEEERKILEEYCQQSQRTKTEILRELVRSLNQKSPTPPPLLSTPGEEKRYATARVEHVSQESELRAMKVSARNVLRGTVTRVVMGAVNTEVTLEIAPGVELISMITRTSAEQLGLFEGKDAYAVIKSSSVIISAD